MKRFFSCLVAVVAALLALLAVAAWFVLTGGMPLQDGVQIGGGAITVIADESSSPFPSAAYLLDLPDGGVALIDAGMDPEAKAIYSALSRRGAAPGDVRAILFTHGHGDHTGGAGAFPQAELYALERDSTVPARSPLNRLEGRAPKSGGQDPTSQRPVRRLPGGQSFDLHGIQVEVFAIPGHTNDSAAYLVHGVLFLGDSAAADSQGGITGAPPFVSSDRDRSLRELKRLAELLRDRRDQIQYLAFGHQGPLEGLDPLLDWATDQQ